ncbi:Hypothetical predicted protein [Olea europaea subsp. europaea]|uniref:Uncharacterized protein n=1 Tax=Olea europaea subsp. europaea TaxID=158383 RepID=A0A8S0QKT8_OLEEU|nr:Hypothetical predicted protein [Olea europaea subsp. europaea]
MPANEVASLPWPGRIPDMAYTPCLETAQKCLKSGCVPAVAWMCRELGWHTVSQKLLEMPKNQATSLPRLGHGYTPCPRNFLEMPENQVTSMSQLGRVPDMAFTL